MTSSSAQAKQDVCLARLSSIRHISARSVSRIKVILSYSPGEMGEVGWGALDALSESLDGFLEICESAVLVHDLISPSKFLEQEHPDYFCLL